MSSSADSAQPAESLQQAEFLQASAVGMSPSVDSARPAESLQQAELLQAPDVGMSPSADFLPLGEASPQAEMPHAEASRGAEISRPVETSRPVPSLASTHAANPEASRWEGAAELVAPATTRLGALLRAERYLVLRERSRLSRYHLVQAHVAAALASGGSIAECRQVLQELTQARLPESIEARLTAWDQRFGALTIRPAVILEGRSAADVDAAIADESVRPFVRGRLSPWMVEVAAADALELAAALRAGGQLPRIDAALRLASEPKLAYAGLVDEQVLEFLLVSLLAFQTAWPERLAELEGSTGLLERLEHQFSPARLAELRAAAGRLAGSLTARTAAPPRRRRRTARR
jgi:hypothetical protein